MSDLEPTRMIPTPVAEELPRPVQAVSPPATDPSIDFFNNYDAKIKIGDQVYQVPRGFAHVFKWLCEQIASVRSDLFNSNQIQRSHTLDVQDALDARLIDVDEKHDLSLMALTDRFDCLIKYIENLAENGSTKKITNDVVESLGECNGD